MTDGHPSAFSTCSENWYHLNTGIREATPVHNVRPRGFGGIKSHPRGSPGVKSTNTVYEAQSSRTNVGPIAK